MYFALPVPPDKIGSYRKYPYVDGSYIKNVLVRAAHSSWLTDQLFANVYSWPGRRTLRPLRWGDLAVSTPPFLVSHWTRQVKPSPANQTAYRRQSAFSRASTASRVLVSTTLRVQQASTMKALWARWKTCRQQKPILMQIHIMPRSMTMISIKHSPPLCRRCNHPQSQPCIHRPTHSVPYAGFCAG